MARKVFSLIMVVVLSISMFKLVGCFEKSSKYTEEEHFKRVSKRVEKRYFSKSNKEFTGYELFPIYNEKEQLQYFLVEFEPQGYIYILINERDMNPILAGMYTVESRGIGHRGSNKNPLSYDYWYRYTLRDRTLESVDSSRDFIYETDENGERIKYYNSQYEEAGIKGERRYLLKVVQAGREDLIPAVKRGDKYLNLISMQEFVYEYETDVVKYERTSIYFPPKQVCDL